MSPPTSSSGKVNTYTALDRLVVGRGGGITTCLYPCETLPRALSFRSRATSLAASNFGESTSLAEDREAVAMVMVRERQWSGALMAVLPGAVRLVDPR